MTRFSTFQSLTCNLQLTMMDSRTHTTALKGRKQQLTLLEGALERMEAGDGSVVVITGEPGIGKSRLLEELHHNHQTGVTWLRGAAHSFSQGISYWPFVEMLKLWFGLNEHETPREHWKKIERAYSDLEGGNVDEFFPYMAMLLGTEAQGPFAERLRQLDVESMGAQIRRAALHFFDRLSQGAPVILLIDDFQWIDRSSLELLEHLLRLVSTNFFLVILAARPDSDLHTHLITRARARMPHQIHEMALRPLAPRDSNSLVEELVGVDASTLALRNAIVVKAEGNPYFIEEIVRDLKERRSIVQDGTGENWVAREPGPIPIPDTIQAAIDGRLDRLDEHLKLVLSVASVIGRVFFYRVLRAVTPPDASLDQRLRELTSIQLLDEFRSAPELAYLFHHAIAQETLYSHLPEEYRRAIHDRVGACLEALYVDRTQEVTSLIAFHYVRAQNWEKAIYYLLASAEYSSRMAADSEALAHYVEAVLTYGKVFGETWDKGQRAKIELRLGQIYFRRGEREQALEHISQSLDLLGERLPRHDYFALSTAREIIRMVLDECKELLIQQKLVEPAREAAETLTNCYEVLAWMYATNKASRVPYILLRILYVGRRYAYGEAFGAGLSGLGFTLDDLALWRLASYYHSRARRVAQRASSSRLDVVNGMMLTTHFYLKGDWSEAQKIGLETIQKTEQTGHLEILTNTTCIMCEIWSEQGEQNRTLAQADRLIRLGRDAAFTLALALGLMQRGISLTRLGRCQEAEAAFCECLALARGSYDTFTLAVGASDYAICLLRLGKLEEADKVFADLERELQGSFQFAAARMHLDRARAEISVALFEQRRDEETQVKAADACKRLLRSARTARLGAPSARRLQGTLDWLRGSKKRARRYWRAGIAEAAILGARLELGLVNYEMNLREGRPAEAAKWKAMLASLGQH